MFYLIEVYMDYFTILQNIDIDMPQIMLFRKANLPVLMTDQIPMTARRAMRLITYGRPFLGNSV